MRDKDSPSSWRGKFFICFSLFAAALLFPSFASAYWFIHQNQSLDPGVSKEIFRPAEDGSLPSPGNPPVPVVMEILPLPEGFSDEVAEAVRRAVKRWDQVPGSSLRVSVIGPSSGEYDGNWASRFGAPDGRNTIEFITEGWPSFLGPNYIGATMPITDDEGRILEADIFLNAENYRFVVFKEEGSFPALAEKNLVDVEALVTHEMGHVFGLGHSRFSYASMFFLPGLADTRARHLTSDDIAGLCRLYPATQADVPPPSLRGIHEATFGGDCGAGTLTELDAQIFYVQRDSPLPGPHELISSPPQAGETVWPYCLLGAGFRGAEFVGMDLERQGQPLLTVLNAEFITPNFVRAVVMNGSSVFPLLAAGAYDAAVYQDPGGAGLLPQALFVNPQGNNLPEAVVEPEEVETTARAAVRLDGSLSSDPDGDPLSFFWEVVEEPSPGAAVLSSDTAESVVLSTAAAGIYVVRLVVNDGVTDGIASQAVVKAVRTRVKSGDSGGLSLFGCWASPPPDGKKEGMQALFLFFAFILLFWTFLKKTTTGKMMNSKARDKRK